MSVEHVDVAVVSVSHIEIIVFKDPLLSFRVVANLVAVLTSFLDPGVCEVPVKED